jgi:hypothetical protein
MKMIFKSKIFFLLIIFLFLINCSSTNDKAFNKKILDYESSGSPSLALSLGAPSAAILFLTVDITNYLKFNLNKKEADMHINAIQLALNNAPNGKIVSWYNNDRPSSGKVRVVKTYYKHDRYCRIFQSYIKLNGAKNHTTKHVCKVNNVWEF